jgi:hypothetical protein
MRYLSIKIHTIQPRDLKALKTFGEDYPEAERFVLYRGSEKLRRDGIMIYPSQDFLLSLA